MFIPERSLENCSLHSRMFGMFPDVFDAEELVAFIKGDGYDAWSEALQPEPGSQWSGWWENLQETMCFLPLLVGGLEYQFYCPIYWE